MTISWSSFSSKFTEAEMKQYVPNAAGVYLLWVKLKNGNWRCFYAGQTDDLKRRLLEHLNNNETNKCIKNKVTNYIYGFEYAKVVKQTERDGIEKFLYDHYKPECNDKDPGSEPIEVNLP